ncbi:MAG: hypothetical protein VB144_13965 [Clostridia bacterium]|nr:hypothetical protein [Clostridia bacterium]
MRRLAMAIGLCALLMLVGSMCLAAPAAPTGKVVLTVIGPIDEKNCEKGFEFDMAMLEKVGIQICETRDPWLGNKKYGGVLISEILKYVGASKSASEILAIAKDGKKVTIKAEDLAKYPIMLATQDGGKAIGSGLGGPIKLVFPYAGFPELEAAYNKEQWNWFVVTLEVKVK